ncbi:MAG TPA: hypothetical protein VGH28_15575 [Polyangiaceae bacterium]|jgi:hypothetical protein
MKRQAWLGVVFFLLVACGSSSPPSDGGTVDASSDVVVDVASEAAPACKHAGDTCAPTDSCNTWSCKCANISNPEITVGGCQGGTCQSGADACAALCGNAGGVTSATDTGC